MMSFFINFLQRLKPKAKVPLVKVEHIPMVVYGLPLLLYKLTFYFESHLMTTNASIESYEAVVTILKCFEIDLHYNSNWNV